MRRIAAASIVLLMSGAVIVLAGIWVGARSGDKVATVEEVIEAFNDHDADVYASHWTETALGPGGIAVRAPEFQRSMAEQQARGGRITLSDCEENRNTVQCLETYEETLLKGKAGVAVTWEAEYAFDDDGRIVRFAWYNRRGDEARGDRVYPKGGEVTAFVSDLGNWMALEYPEAFPVYFVPGYYSAREENWSSAEGAARLSRLIDEFVDQSATYPLH